MKEEDNIRKEVINKIVKSVLKVNEVELSTSIVNEIINHQYKINRELFEKNENVLNKYFGSWKNIKDLKEHKQNIKETILKQGGTLVDVNRALRKDSIEYIKGEQRAVKENKSMTKLIIFKK
jgi:ABC-type sulfate transport system substrate-binding protein